jgi:hypothetical protein
MLESPTRLPCDVVVRTEITFDRRASVVWSCLVDMHRWMHGLSFQNVRGQTGEEGQVRLVTPEGDSLYGKYFITTVRARPFEQYVLKVAPEQGTDYFGFVDFSLTEKDGETHMIYDIYVELKVTAAGAEELRRISEEQCAGVRAEVSRNNAALKRIVESR